MPSAARDGAYDIKNTRHMSKVPNNWKSIEMLEEEAKVPLTKNAARKLLKDQDKAAKKKAAAERLIEQTLVRREMELGHYSLPGLSEADPLEQELQTKYGSAADFDRALSKAGVAEPSLKQHLWWQLTLLRFIDYRFRPAVQVQDRAVKDYYEKKRAEWQQQGAKPIPSLEDSRTDIEKILTEQRIESAMVLWLVDSRKSIEILYRKEAFQ